MFGVVQTPSGRAFASFHNRGWNMNSPQHTVDQAAFKMVGFSGWIGAKEDEFVSQQTHDFSFWDARDIIHIDNLQMGKSINGEYYAS